MVPSWFVTIMKMVVMPGCEVVGGDNGNNDVWMWKDRRTGGGREQMEGAVGCLLWCPFPFLLWCVVPHDYPCCLGLVLS